MTIMAKAKATTTAKRHVSGKNGKADLRSQVDVLTVRPLTAKDWPDISALFGDKGACGGCWCMYWRVQRGGRTWDDMRGGNARDHFRALIESGKVHGLLAFEAGTPIGWVCIGPYDDFPRLETVRAFRRERPADTWSIVCFYIPSRYRNSGIATRLLVAARDLAKTHGAKVIEGYPVTIRPGKQLPGAFAWTGVPRMFARTGFRKLGNDKMTRHIWVD
jgi:GNAT superfamily N-acetyltransferase